MLMDGVINAYGVIYLEVTESFGASASQAAWILSIQTCMHGLAGQFLLMVCPESHVLVFLISPFYGKIFLGVSQEWRQEKLRLIVWRWEDHKIEDLCVKTVFLNVKIGKLTHHGTPHPLFIHILPGLAREVADLGSKFLQIYIWFYTYLKIKLFLYRAVEWRFG